MLGSLRCDRSFLAARVLRLLIGLGGVLALFAAADATAQGGQRLAQESSPYLRMHADNPIEWYPWGEEALARARVEDKPIFLSIGFSACHWCRQMERETFSAEWLARILNRSFVNIKVDRDERPDLEAIYLTASQLISGRGGWPTTIFMTPELEPFFAGTYMPLRDQPGQPGFSTIAQTLEHAWKESRVEVEAQAHEVALELARRLAQWPPPVTEVPPEAVAQAAYDGFVQRFDDTWGGFGTEPKFPSAPALYLIFDFLDQPRAEAILEKTLEQMAYGALHDQLGGGFHRYALDRSWRRPRFEKLLADNAQLLSLYARWHRRRGDPLSAEVVRRTVEFLEREMRLPGGGFRSSIAADSIRPDGTLGEGAYYLWTLQEVESVLGAEDALWLTPLWGLDLPASYDEDRRLPFLPRGLDEQAKAFNLEPVKLRQQVDVLRSKLLAAREKRQRPAADDQAITGWNGLMIGALAEAGRALDEPSWIEGARRTARFVLERSANGKLHRLWHDGEARGPAFLTDHAFLIHGLLTLHEVTGEESWRAAAVRLATEQKRLLRAPGGGYFSAVEGLASPFRPIGLRDGAELSGQAMSAINFIELARVTGDRAWREEAAGVLRASAAPVLASPPAFPGLALAVHRFHALPPPAEGGDAAADPATGSGEEGR